MNKILQKIFNFYLYIIGTEKAKTFLWRSLGNVMRKTYPQVDGGGEYASWMQIKNNFKSPSIIDVGANCGKLCKLFLEVFPEARIYAVEPIPEFFEQIDDSKLVSKSNLALTNKNKTLTLYQSGGGSKPFPKFTKGKKTATFDVRAITGDSFVNEANIEKVDIIKIDTEGFDFEVLQGFVEVLKNDKPFVQFELSKWWLKMGYTFKQAQRLFEDLNYDLYKMSDNGIEVLNIDIPDSLFITVNFLAVPRESNFKLFN